MIELNAERKALKSQQETGVTKRVCKIPATHALPYHFSIKILEILSKLLKLKEILVGDVGLEPTTR